MPELIINTGPLIALCAAVEDLQVLKSCYACIHVLSISTVSIDEKIGRRVARLHSLSVTGSTGMLLKCANSGGISDLESCFSAMRKKGIWISESITRNALLHWQEGGG
jgi:predicted nucleic acid-binding protein